MKRTLGPGCHLLHGPGIPAGSAPRDASCTGDSEWHWRTDSLILVLIAGELLIAPLFLPTLGCSRLIDSAVDRTTRNAELPEAKGARGVNDPRSRFPKQKGKGKRERGIRLERKSPSEFEMRRGLLIG
jgi:hypothetical protein